MSSRRFADDWDFRIRRYGRIFNVEKMKRLPEVGLWEQQEKET